MKKNILVLTDFSRNSWDALTYAMELYNSETCNYYLLNAYHIEAFGLKSTVKLDPEETFNNLSRQRSVEGLGHIMNRLMEHGSARKNDFFVMSKPYELLEAVSQVLDDISIDVVVMGAKGCSDMPGRAYGKATIEIMSHIRDCAIIVVPKDAKFKNPGEIVFATDFRARPDESSFRHLLTIVNKTGAQLCVLSLVDTAFLSSRQEENLDSLRVALRKQAHSFHSLPGVDLRGAIGRFVETRDSQLVSIIPAKPGLWERIGVKKLFFERLQYQGNLPLMALHGSF